AGLAPRGDEHRGADAGNAACCVFGLSGMGGSRSVRAQVTPAPPADRSCRRPSTSRFAVAWSPTRPSLSPAPPNKITILTRAVPVWLAPIGVSRLSLSNYSQQ